MGFFNDIGKKTSETTSRIAKETKLKMKVNENKGKLNDLYKELGKKTYRQYKQEEDTGNIEEECKQLDSLIEEIKQANIEILALNNKKVCPNCGEELEFEAQFCQKCGTKQVEISEPPAKEVEIIENNQESKNSEDQNN